MIPAALQDIIDQFVQAPQALRLDLLLEYANSLPELPEALRDSDRLERVHECQTPFFVLAEVAQGRSQLYFDAPPEAPTTRGFAGVIHAGLDGEAPEVIQQVPSDFYTHMKLAELISPLRLRGMEAIMRRLQQQLAA